MGGSGRAHARDAHVSDDEAIANMGHPDCAGTGEERETAGSLPFGFAQGRNDNQKGKGNSKS